MKGFPHRLRLFVAALLFAGTPHLFISHAQAVFTTNTPRHIPPWSVSRPPVPSQTPQITPGGTFSRPQSTFSPQTGSFSRPTSTFSHPGSAYTPLPPIQVPVDRPDRRPHHRRPVNLYPQSVIVHNPVIYEPYYVPVEVPVAEAATFPPAETQATADPAPPVVLDLPPGTIIRRPGSTTAPTSISTPVPAAPATISPPIERPATPPAPASAETPKTAPAAVPQSAPGK